MYLIPLQTQELDTTRPQDMCLLNFASNSTLGFCNSETHGRHLFGAVTIKEAWVYQSSFIILKTEGSYFCCIKMAPHKNNNGKPANFVFVTFAYKPICSTAVPTGSTVSHTDFQS
jgi:hypothetical protein